MTTASATPADPISSPCTRVCTLDEHRSVCIGCGRTLEEIMNWSYYSHDQRQTIMARLSSLPKPNWTSP
ncbi:DUF1289 domain-containing protein [Allorhizobium taibaishanense]|uniref:DUF1289 domain-containing protein n=1 Tax=Allorhizobium taibaishanense TaxID=887144 RepID=A0A7W6HIX5_9HYPH|nr:DUF1289 domain-containing protein [Allorhizobium taibaishanense]MBB4006054.1 hypothetical protein [Allorhizobium taibaishanense]